MRPTPWKGKRATKEKGRRKIVPQQKNVTVHGVLALAMPARTPRQQARNCGLKHRVSLDLEQQGSPDLKQQGCLNIEQRGSPCQSPPQHFSRILTFSGQPMDLDPAAGNDLLAALGRCGKQSAVPACPTAEMGMGIFPP
jgi:hypothetical protein